MPKSPFSKVLCSKESLKEWLLFDLKNIGISISNEELEIKPYSSSCYGRYNVNKGKIKAKERIMNRYYNSFDKRIGIFLADMNDLYGKFFGTP